MTPTQESFLAQEKDAAGQSVVLLMFFTALCTVERDCINDKILQGAARNSDPISNAKSGVLYSEFLSMCYAGVQCGHYCMDDSSEWNYFEVGKVSPLFPLTAN